MRQMRRIVIAGMIGNALEWYDFALYGYFATIIGKIFLPGHDPYVQMLATYGIFAAGFVTRPIGAILFGYLGDKYGRKFSLTLSMFMMAIPTAAIAFLPTYNSIGIWAPTLLTILRFVQGLSLAGQYSGSIAFVIEHAPRNRRGLAGSSVTMSLCMGMLLGSLTATLFAKFLSPEHFESWGWRIPFMFGLIIAGVGYYIRNETEESPHYEKAKIEGHLSKSPLKDAFKYHLISLFRGVGVYLCVTVPFYTLTVFLNNYIILNLGITRGNAYFISTLNMVFMLIVTPLAAYFSDIIGRKKLLMWTAAIYVLTAFPIFMIINTGDFIGILLAELAFSVLVAIYIGTVPSVLVELFPTSIRYTGMALSYNVAAILGGATPFIETWLVKHTQINSIVAVYIAVCGILSFIAFIAYHDRYKEELL